MDANPGATPAVQLPVRTVNPPNTSSVTPQHATLSLHEAVEKGLQPAVQQRLDAGESLEATDSRGRTPLVVAVQMGHEAIVRLLLERGAHVDASKLRSGVLHVATMTRDERLTRILLDNGAPVNGYSSAGLTPLHTAVYGGEKAVVRLLLERGANVNAKVQARAGKGETALHMAVASWKEELLPLLLKNGAEVNAKGENPKGQTALHVAASWGNETALETLLKHGADLSARYENGDTALHVAAVGRFQMVDLLLRKGADIRAENERNETALCLAAYKGKLTICEILVEKGNTMMSAEQKARALSCAASAGKLDVTSMMIMKGYGKILENRGTVGAFLVAAKFGQDKVLVYLLKNAVIPNMEDVVWGTAVKWASDGGHRTTVRLLEQAYQTRQNPAAGLYIDSDTNDLTFAEGAIAYTIRMDIALSVHRNYVANPVPGGLPSSCTICHDLNFRRGVRPDVGVVHVVTGKDFAWTVSKGCPGCSLLRKCLDRLSMAYEDSLDPKIDGMEQSLILISMVKDGPLFVAWQRPPGAAPQPYNAAKASLRMELYSKPGFPVDYPVIGASREVPGSSWSVQQQELAHKLLDECSASHQHCSYQIAPLPTRVIDVGDFDSDPRLYITQGEKAKYIALSHCWGGGSPITTTTETLEQRCQAMPLDDLPKTFKDAVIIARDLGVRYLWIDSLCILQNNAEDWEIEAAMMNDVYANCYVMIAADGSDNCRGGCFRSEADNKPTTFAVECPGPSGRPSRAYFRLTNMRDQNQDEICHRLYDTRNLYIRSPLNDRGWTLQERLLAPRTLHFGTSEMGWECNERIACECQIHSTEPDREFNFKARLLNAIPADASEHITGSTRPHQQWLWANVIQDFTRRTLTKDTDALYALSGLAKRMSLTASNEYVCGMWKNNLEGYLMWKPDYEYIRTGQVAIGSKFRKCQAPTRRDKYYAPSWSWASIVGPITFGSGPDLIGPDEKVQFKLNKGEAHWPGACAYDFSVQSVKCISDPRSPFGPPVSASLVLNGFVASAVLQKVVDDWSNRSFDNENLLAARNSNKGAILASSTAYFLPDVPADLLDLSVTTELLLFFIHWSPPAKSSPGSPPENPFKPKPKASCSGLVLKQVEDVDTGKSHTRVGTFSCYGDEEVQGWEKFRAIETVTVV